MWRSAGSRIARPADSNGRKATWGLSCLDWRIGQSTGGQNCGQVSHTQPENIRWTRAFLPRYLRQDAYSVGDWPFLRLLCKLMCMRGHDDLKCCTAPLKSSRRRQNSIEARPGSFYASGTGGTSPLRVTCTIAVATSCLTRRPLFAGGARRDFARRGRRACRCGGAISNPVVDHL